MVENTPEARGRRLVDALLTRGVEKVEKSDLPLKCALSRFEVESDSGDTWIERLRR